MTDKKLSCQDLEYVINKMNFYRRTSGYIAIIDNDKIEFFDSKPSIPSAHVTKVVLERSLRDAKFNNEC